MLRKVVPLQSMEVHDGADIHLQLMEGTPCRSRWMPEGSCDPMGSPVLEQASARTCRPVEGGAHTRAGLLEGLVTLWGPTLEQPVPEGRHSMEETYAGAVQEEQQPMGRTHIGEVFGEPSPVRGTFTLEQGRSVRSLPPEGQGAVETMCDELTITPISLPPVSPGGRG